MITFIRKLLFDLRQQAKFEPDIFQALVEEFSQKEGPLFPLKQPRKFRRPSSVNNSLIAS